jgi:hypothetical protein
MPHLGITLLLAVLLSGIISTTGEGRALERLWRAAYLFTTSVGLVVAGGWLMFFIEK